MMDATTSIEVKEPSGGTQSDSLVGSIQEKRPIENGGGEELGGPCNKKAKTEAASSGELKRVAEIVLVLSTMASIRGGKKPTEVEVGLMKEAKAKLVELCQGLAPKDIVAGEAIGTVIEDLGLNGKVKEQKTGFRTPRLSIAERFSHSRRKMEESKKFSPHSGTYTSHPLPTSFSATGPSHSIRVFQSDNKSTYMPISSGTASPVVHISAATATSLQYQTPTNDVRPSMVSSGMPSNNLGREPSSSAFPRVERPQFKVDAGSNGSSFTLQVQANSSANQPLLNAPTWSFQGQSASLVRSGPENKVPNHSSVKVKQMGDQTVSRMDPPVARDQSFRPFVTQTASGNLATMHQPIQGMNIVQPPSLSNNHTEIAKVVQKLLQPRLPDHPVWTPPSRDYMNKAFICQVCELTVNEVDTVLLCDACEKGFHLKCLQASVLRGIPRGEWHCIRCLTLSNGKPLPPKYGRVMRSSNTPPRLPSNTGAVQSSSEKKVETLDPNISQQNITANESSALQSPPPTAGVGNSYIESPSDSKLANTRKLQGHTFSLSTKHMDEKPFSGSGPNISTNTLVAASSSPFVGSISECSAQQMKISESSKCEERSFSSKSEPPPKLSETVSNKSDNLQSSDNSQVINQSGRQNHAKVPLNKCHDSSLTDNNTKESCVRENLDCTSRYARDDHNVSLASFDGDIGPNTESRHYPGFTSDGLRAVEWIGNVHQVVDEKFFFESCCVDGVTYKLQDHAFFPSNRGKLIPSKLQSMWEDSKTGLKWVIVRRCYFPGDLPENIGHPCTEDSEVYESNRDSTEMAGSIQGPCEVLPVSKFKEETERRSRLGLEENSGLHPVFLCKWLYDESKRLFQPVTG
ncbi:PHD finger protein [Quillaja saponaria]|uniref:PHD finger protein n=1 Tax=Quillaja saponaria TaxID=32244 RepID=A0AAD7PPS0_QUISA|nr:PHD finger protein [Quillaja saponaria]